MSASDQVTTITDVGKPPDVVAADCLVVIYRREGPAGKCIKLDRTPIRIGREPGNEIELDDDGVSRQHARLERLEDGRLVLSDVGSTNGTLLNDTELRRATELRNGDQIKIGSTIFKYLCATDLEAALYEQIYDNTITDFLTKLRNRRYFEDELAREFSRSLRHGRPLSLLLIDIDHFKGVNDRYGHHVGDIALRATADAMRGSLRTEDTLARFGGEEIVALLPETTLEQSVVLAERIRASVAQTRIAFRDEHFSVTVSIGCAERYPSEADATAFIQRCDAKVYEAKHAGRDRVCS